MFFLCTFLFVTIFPCSNNGSKFHIYASSHPAILGIENIIPRGQFFLNSFSKLKNKLSEN